MRLFIVRHGESYSNVQGKMMSSTDLPLTEKGIRQAEAAGAYLTGILQADTFHHVFSSPLIRARQTAEIISGGMGHVNHSEDLREMNLGRLEGLTWAERDALYPEIDISRSLSRAVLPEGECYQDIRSRCGNFIAGLQAEDQDNILIVTHGITSRVLINCILDQSDACVDYLNWADNTAITEVMLRLEDNVRELKRLNDRQHLLDLGLETDGHENWGIFSDIAYPPEI